MLSYPILLSQILKYFWREKYQYLIYFVIFLDFRSFWEGKNNAGENWARQIRFSGADETCQSLKGLITPVNFIL